MTKPTITYGHGFLDDCNSTTDWTKTEVGLSATTHTILNGDYFDLAGTCDDAGDEYMYITRDLTALSLSTDIAPKLLVRWKTSAAANGLQAKIKVWYVGGATTETVLGFSTLYTTSTVNLTPGKVLQYIRLYADDNPDSLAAGTFHVYYDFVMVCQGVFTWPFTGGVRLDGYNNIPRLKIINKVGNATQWLGADDSALRVWGDIDSTGVDAAGVPQVNQGWHGRWTTKDAEAFYQILHYCFCDPWQWFTSEVGSLKVTMDHFGIEQSDTCNNLLRYELDMHEYRLGSAHLETSLERFGIWP
ncbi:hypothetical protein MUP79_04930 [Candidatus Bathyarchaeota archaeon]|nr:hypothetical protein [Candidatus Bathyarchaeota archaeon]